MLATSSRGPTHIIDWGGGGGWRDVFGSEILAKRDLFGSMKDAGIFLGHKKSTGILLGIVLFISSNQQ